MAQQRSRYIKAFDGLRAIATLAVLFYHLSPAFMPSGYFGVVIFFVLAGFLTVRQVLLKEDRTRLRLPTPYLARRLSKLLPPLLLMLLVVTLVMLLTPSYRSFLPRYPAALLSTLFGVNNQTQMFLKVSYFETHGYLRPLKHMWALSLEWQFYLFFAFTFHRLYRARDRMKWARLALGGSLLSYALLLITFKTTEGALVYYSFFTRLHAFLLGSLGALGFVYVPQRIITTRSWTGLETYYVDDVPRNPLGKRGSPSEGLAAILLLLIVIGFFIPFSLDKGILIGLPVYALMATMLAVFIHEDKGRVSLFLRFKPFPWVASRSYEIYLWHYPIITFLMYELGKTRTPLFLRYVLCFIVSLLAAEVAHRLVYGLRNLQRSYPNSRLARGLHMLTLALFIVLFVISIALFIKSPEDTELQQLEAQIKEQEQRLEEQQRKKQAQANEGAKDDTAKDDTQTTAQDEKPADSSEENSDALIPSDESTAKEKPSFLSASETDDQASSDSKRELDVQALMDDPAETEAYQYFKEWFPLGGDFLMTQDEYNQIRDIPITIIGDSLGVGISYATDVFLPNCQIYAKSNRFLNEAPAIVQSLLQQDALGDPVFIMLGTNGEIDRADLEKLHSLLADRQMMIASIILPGGETEARRNKVIYQFAEDNPDVKLIDWYDQAKGNVDIFQSDLTHTSIAGTRAYIQLICSALVDLYATP